jgi:hypothetical protein
MSVTLDTPGCTWTPRPSPKSGAGRSVANPVAEAQHPVASDDHIGVLQQVLASHQAEAV